MQRVNLIAVVVQPCLLIKLSATQTAISSSLVTIFGIFISCNARNIDNTEIAVLLFSSLKH